MIPSKILELKAIDLVKAGLLSAIVVGIDAIYQLVHMCTSLACFGAFDWFGLLKTVVIAFVSYIFKQTFTDENGKFLGKIG